MPREALLYRRFAFFMSELNDERGTPLIVEEHHEEWCDLMQHCPLLVLMAPRDHGKSYTAIAYLLWQIWRHNRDPETGQLYEDLHEGRFQAILFSAIKNQAEEFFERFQALILANEELFADTLPTFRRGTANRTVWSRTRVRMRNQAEVSIRSYQTSTRGLHPDLIICDDVLNDRNTLTSYQRDKVWRYFLGTLMPMNAGQYIVIGTAFHYDDLLHRLKPDPKKAPLKIVDKRTGRSMLRPFRWVKYRAVNWDTGDVLWKARHDLVDLEGKRDQDPLLFSREYQNDPRDDASSLFPHSLTKQALDAGANMTWYPLEPGAYRKAAAEVVLAGLDLASSESVGADYTVMMVAAVDRHTGRRRLLWAMREKGLSFSDQLDYMARATEAFGIDMGMVEDNNFQKWLRREAVKDGRLAGRWTGHNTGSEKRRLDQGVPSLKLGLLDQLWVFPTAGEDERRFAAIWQSELNAFGWKDDKLQGVGEHDDTVMATWFLDLAARQADEWIRSGEPEETVTADETDFEPVEISRREY